MELQGCLDFPCRIIIRLKNDGRKVSIGYEFGKEVVTMGNADDRFTEDLRSTTPYVPFFPAFFRLVAKKIARLRSPKL